MTQYGRFTVAGSEAFEQDLAGRVREMTGRLIAALEPGEMVALCLIGGYGRGEGGVEVVAGRERPHNNLDLLLLSRKTDPAALRARLAPLIRKEAARVGCGLDLGVVSYAALKRAPCRLMWFEARHGHKILAGDPEALQRLGRFTLDRVQPREMRDLMANRGTLLVLNDLALESDILDEETRRMIVRHLIKAILGFGDALLYFHGRYHHMALERRARLSRLLVPPGFGQLYEAAVEFRLRPDYARRAPRDVRRWQAEVRAILEKVHLEVEARRLGGDRAWSDYARRAYRSLPSEDRSLGILARRARNYLSNTAGPDVPAELRAVYLSASDQERVAIALPIVAYGADDAVGRVLAGSLLGASPKDSAALRLAYLRAWARHGDVNAGALVARLGRLRGEAASAA